MAYSGLIETRTQYRPPRREYNEFEADFVPRIELLKQRIYGYNRGLSVMPIERNGTRVLDVVLATTDYPYAHHLYNKNEPQWAMPPIFADCLNDRKSCLANICIMDHGAHTLLHSYGKEHPAWMQQWNDELALVHMILIIRNLKQLKDLLCHEDYEIILKVKARMQLLGLLEKRINILEEA